MGGGIIFSLSINNMNEDKIVTMLLDHGERLDRIEDKLTGMVTKDDHQEVMRAIDGLAKMVKDANQEVVMLARGERRLDDRITATDIRVMVLEKDVKQMKPALGIS